jgi:hypothetical protein
MTKKVEKMRWDLDKIVPVVLLAVIAVGGFAYAVAARFGQGNSAKPAAATAQQKVPAFPGAKSYFDHMREEIAKSGSGSANWGPQDLERVIEASRRNAESIVQSIQVQPIQEQPTARPSPR